MAPPSALRVIYDDVYRMVRDSKGGMLVHIPGDGSKQIRRRQGFITTAHFPARGGPRSTLKRLMLTLFGQRSKGLFRGTTLLVAMACQTRHLCMQMASLPMRHVFGACSMAPGCHRHVSGVGAAIKISSYEAVVHRLVACSGMHQTNAKHVPWRLVNLAPLKSWSHRGTVTKLSNADRWFKPSRGAAAGANLQVQFTRPLLDASWTQLNPPRPRQGRDGYGV